MEFTKFKMLIYLNLGEIPIPMATRKIKSSHLVSVIKKHSFLHWWLIIFVKIIALYEIL